MLVQSDHTGVEGIPADAAETGADAAANVAVAKFGTEGLKPSRD